MAGSDITKRALAEAFKELLVDTPFDKISVGAVCERCGLSRKSFYYHFADKYDLVNWIYDAELARAVEDVDADRPWQRLLAMCRHLDRNRPFYRQALLIRGRNSFSEHFHRLIRDSVAHSLEKSLPSISACSSTPTRSPRRSAGGSWTSATRRPRSSSFSSPKASAPPPPSQTGSPSRQVGMGSRRTPTQFLPDVPKPHRWACLSHDRPKAPSYHRSIREPGNGRSRNG